MLRAFAAAVVVANLLFFAWAQGWLASFVAPPMHGEREPQRLAAQVRPEAVRVMPVPAAASAAAERTACLRAGPFTDADVGIAEAALLGSGVPASAWQRDTDQQAGAWLVYMGPFADAAALRQKDEELRRLRVGAEEVRAPVDLAPGLALSRHASRPAADEALQQFTDRGVRTARVVSVPPPPQQHWLRVPRADARLQERLQALQPPAFSAPFSPCPKG